MHVYQFLCLYYVLLHALFVLSFKNLALTDAISKVATDFECAPVEGILSHRLKKNLYDGEKTIILNPSDNQRYSNLW